MNKDDRRWSTRVKGNLPINYRASSTAYQRGSLINMSYSGARLVVSATEAAAGPFIEMKIDLGNGESCRVTGLKMWQTPAGQHTCVVGVRFYRPNVKAKAQLAQWIATRLWAAA